MLIVCPNCGTSYMVDPAALGSGGRTVRCARCKTTWFAGWQKQAPNLNAFVDGVIAEAAAQAGPDSAQPPSAEPPAVGAPPAADDFGSEPAEPTTAEPEAASAPAGAGGADGEAGAPAEAPVALEEAPSLVPPLEHEPLPGEGAEADSEDVESYAARRQRLQSRRKQARRSSRWTAVVLVLFAVNVALIGARNEVVRYLPQTASLFAAIGLPVNLRHLTFENVQISKELQDGVNILVVHGTIVSAADKPVAVPRLRFAARDAAGQEIYVWTALPSRSILGPGERLEFHSRLASPPAEAKNVLVRFFNAQDAAAAGAQ
jgi:predicted Zn finger-like uncharacterized protein